MAELKNAIDPELARRAEAQGICLEYEDVWGRRRVASEKCVRAILAAVEADEPERPATAALVVREGLPLHLPAGAQWRLSEEEGRVRSGRGDLPADLPIGYHRLETVDDRNPALRRLIVCPARAHLPPALESGARWWGGTLQLYGLRSANNWGIGDFGDLRRCAALWGSAGASFLGTNPLHALSPAEPDRASPYSPASRCFLNPLYLDVEAIDECRDAPELRALPADTLRDLRGAPFVDYRGVAAAKHHVLGRAYARFLEQHGDGGTPRAAEFEAFRRERGADLRDFAVFAALQEHLLSEGYGAAWQQWPLEFRSSGAAAVERFAKRAAHRVGYFEFLQWQCSVQLARAQSACRAHGMPIGVYADLSVSVDRGGAEAWARQSCYALGASIGAPPDEYNRAGQNWGLPPLVPSRLIAEGYAPFIATLRANMAHAGALRIDHVMGLARLYWIPDGHDPADGAYVRYPFAEQLGVLALESVRNRCMVIGEDLGTVPREVRGTLAATGVLSCRLLIFERDKAGEFLPSADYPRLSFAACTTHDLPTTAGYWSNADPARQLEQKALARALEREGPTDADRTYAMHRYLARSPAALMGVQFEDIAGATEQVNLPGTPDERPNWRRKLPVSLEDWAGDARFTRTVATMAETRPRDAAVKPAAAIPRATYRLQLHRGFTFRDAQALLPYLDELGVSHVYCSPYLRSRSGSQHGYDVIDHRSLDPEIGTPGDYAAFVAALHARGMGQLMDVVPNHMAIGSDNAWWMDVLENGPASAYAGYFDIDWQPASASLENRVLLPVLGDHYGAVLESGAFSLAFHRETGTLALKYGEQRFPLDPRQYVRVLDRAFALVGSAVPAAARSEYAGIVAAFGALPPREARTAQHRAGIAGTKQRLVSLVASRAEIGDAIDLAAQSFAGRQDEPASFDALHGLLEAQAYRLAYWRVASDEINYRRFFDVNELAALRMESDAAFEATHAFVGALLRSGAVDGLRIDHPDGLFDPAAYFQRLHDLAGRPLYVVIEKILARNETIPPGWAIDGLTGYRFAAVVNGLYVDREAEAAVTRTYRAFTGVTESFEEIAYRSKRVVLLTAMASELTVLANRLARIAQADRSTRDYTLNTLRLAIATVIASFPVYRTYIADEPSAQDRRHIERAIAQASRRGRAGDVSIFEFIGRALLCETAPHARAAVRHFARKFQQLSAPVMAKGVEDTAFYIFNRLVSLNDVGDDPAAFGCSVAQLHTANADRALRWPHSMLATSTHDNKRSEDVRARINVISELPAAWRLQLRRWGAMNRPHKREVDGNPAPSANDEYLLYQTLLGTWPADPGEAASVEYRERIERYMLKAVREAKMETSWLNAHEPYEDAMLGFVRALLAPGNPFAAELAAAVAAITPPALQAGLSKLLIKITAPGVPDCYQGNELPDLSLVDPDNRRPVDYALRRRKLDEVKALWAAGGAASLLRSLPDGRAKLFVLWRLLALRREQEELFRDGRYVALETSGPRARHLFCFARMQGKQAMLTFAGRLFAGLMAEGADPARGWEGTRVETPLLPDGTKLVNALTGARYAVARGCLELSEVFSDFPGAVLYCDDVSAIAED